MPPSSACFSGRIIAAGVCDGNIVSKFTILQELTVISASLLLSVSTSVLFNLPTECYDGTSCTKLRTINAVGWTLVTVCFLMVTIQSWVLMCLCTSVPSAHFAQWYEDHLRFIGLPTFLFVTGITLLY